MAKDWMAKAVPKSHRGKFSAKAKAAGKSTAAYAQAHKHDSGTLGAEARLAITFEKGSKGGWSKMLAAPASPTPCASEATTPEVCIANGVVFAGLLPEVVGQTHDVLQTSSGT